MGTTIHYSGHARDEASLLRLISNAAHFAAAHNWPTRSIDIPDAKVFRWEATSKSGVERPAHLRGLIITPHPDNESVRLVFDSDLRMEEFTKTQFMPFATHVELLRSIGHSFARSRFTMNPASGTTAMPRRPRTNRGRCWGSPASSGTGSGTKGLDVQTGDEEPQD